MSRSLPLSEPRRRSNLTASGTLIRFHLRVGARLALRRLAPALAAVLFLLVFFRIEFFFLVINELGQSGGVILGGTIAALGWISAAAAAPRILLGLNGWIRHLPATADVQRRAALAGLWISLTPVLLLMALLSGLAGVTSSVLAGFPFMGWAAGTASLNLVNKRMVRPLALLSAVLSVSGSWASLIVSLGLTIATDRLAGEVVRSTKPRLSSSLLKIGGLDFLILWRSLRWRLGLSYLLALPPFLVTYAFLVNNPVSSLQAGRARLFGFAMALVIFTAVCANGIAARRPAWPWARSLPRSSHSRIIADAGFLAVHSIPFLLPLAVIGRANLLFLGICLPALSLHAAAALRLAPEKRASALGSVLLFGSLGGTLLTVFPWTSLVFAGSVPLLLSAGARIERERKVSRWLEFHHLAAGDPHSWSQE